MIEKHGLTGIGRKATDFKFGSDIDLNNFPTLKKTDNIRTVVNQSISQGDGIYRSACTMMSTYSAILSYWNKKVDEKFKAKIIAQALIHGYVIGQGRELEEGVNLVIKVRNKEYPNNRMMYVETELLSSSFNEVLQKGYSVIVGYQLSAAFNKDKKDNGIVDGKRFDANYGGHAICTYFSEKNSWTHHNTYPDYAKNTFEVKYGRDLMNNGTYYKTGYAILPEGSYSVEEIKDDKRHKQIEIMLLLMVKSTGDQRYKTAFRKLKEIANDPTANS